ncbi:hypothetical protein PRZ48_015286 [Zasmidium cellare]|uniref:RNase III domain-containing protein n=1 Tax=Zasmidium cellare TaxID=395010 RepID=A0ABR0DWY1_ZASCE|nr:hypothetical protein PRZ48_015286 [Zasmidium cellare]
MSAQPPPAPRLSIDNTYKTLRCGAFAHEFAHPHLLMRALVVPIAYLPSTMQGRPSTYEDGKKLAFLGDSVLKTVMATSWALTEGQDSLFWTTHFDNGLAKDSFLARIGDAIKISHYLVAADGDRMTPDFWENPPLNPNNNPKQKSKVVNEKNKPIPSAAEAVIGAIWSDCLMSEPKREPAERVKAFLWELRMRWPRDEEGREELVGLIENTEELTKEKNEKNMGVQGAGKGKEQGVTPGGS